MSKIIHYNNKSICRWHISVLYYTLVQKRNVNNNFLRTKSAKRSWALIAFFLINNEKFNEPMLFWERTRQISPALGNTWTITASPYEGAKYWFSFKKKKAIYTRKFCLQFSLLFEKLSLLGHFIPLYQSERKTYQAIFTNVIRLSPVRDRLFYTAVFKFIN